MITINNKEYRNIVEQVEKNKEDIARHYAIDRVIAEVGIKVMGQLNTAPADDLIPPGGTDAFGEAYLVGENEPYDIYIWTRPGEWFNIGALNMIGDQGPAGDSIDKAEITTDNKLKLTMSDGREVITKTAFTTIKGDKGETGPENSITAVTVNPDYTVTFTFKDGSYATTNKSLRGEPGAPSTVPGEKGDKGDPGRSIYIKGIVPSVNELKSINPLDDLFGAYLVGTTSPYLLYIPVQEIGEFIYAGQFMGGTVITVGGQTQDTWNADTKLDKYTTTGGGNKIYGINNDGDQKMYTVRNDPQIGNSGTYKNQIVQYDIANNKNTGLIRIAETPTQTYHTASKGYVDNRYRLYRHDINFTVNDSGDSYTCYFTLYNTQPTAMNNGTLHTDTYISLSGIVDKADGRQYPIVYGNINPGVSVVSITYYDHDEKQMISHNLDSATFTTYDTVSRIF